MIAAWRRRQGERIRAGEDIGWLFSVFVRAELWWERRGERKGKR
jgi:hypothetical protein